MDKVNICFSFEDVENKKYLCLAVNDSFLGNPNCTNLFSEAAESLLSCSYTNICYDMSKLTVVSSTLFGVCFNIIVQAEEKSKKVKFKFNKDVYEVARVSGMHRHAEIEAI